MKFQVKVKYKYGADTPTSTATWSGYVTSEYEIMAILQEKHPGKNIQIIKIDK